MRRERRIFSKEFKLSVVRDYYSSGMSKNSCVRKYSLKGIGMLNRWISVCESELKPLSLHPDQSEEALPNRSKDDYKDENAQLKKRIRELEKALDFSKLEVMVRDMMIDKAEEYFDIPIRKKSGAK